MKKCIVSLFASLICFAAIPAQAVQGIIQVGTSNVPISFLLTTQASSGQVGLTGQVVASAIAVTVNKPGSTGFVASTGTLVELGLGYYNYFPSATETASTGVLVIDVEDANAYAPSGGSLQVVAVNLNDAAALGLSKFSAVTLASTQAFNNTGQTTNYPINGGGGSVTDSSVQTDVTTVLTGLGITTGWVSGVSTSNTDVPLIYSQTSAASQQANVTAGVEALPLSKTNKLGKYTYVPTTGVMTLLADDGTTVLGTDTITASGSGIYAGVITSKE